MISYYEAHHEACLYENLVSLTVNKPKKWSCVCFLCHEHIKATTLYSAHSKEWKNLNLFSVMHVAAAAAHIRLFNHSFIHAAIQSADMMAV